MQRMGTTMKLRKVGNSLGLTFPKDVLNKAGITGDDELEVSVVRGEIVLRKAKGGAVVEFNKAEAAALAAGEFESKAGKSALDKVRKVVK